MHFPFGIDPPKSSLLGQFTVFPFLAALLYCHLAAVQMYYLYSLEIKELPKVKADKSHQR
ncbi:MAG TPA: hypothetical protein DHU72_04190 [Rikenellaceae bacterium]|nr:hypothetical protein [Rikenellaceae bacterium]